MLRAERMRGAPRRVAAPGRVKRPATRNPHQPYVLCPLTHTLSRALHATPFSPSALIHVPTDLPRPQRTSHAPPCPVSALWPPAPVAGSTLKLCVNSISLEPVSGSPRTVPADRGRAKSAFGRQEQRRVGDGRRVALVKDGVSRELPPVERPATPVHLHDLRACLR
eukprot:341858-Rhodomonas_salina.1